MTFAAAAEDFGAELNSVLRTIVGSHPGTCRREQLTRGVRVIQELRQRQMAWLDSRSELVLEDLVLNQLGVERRIGQDGLPWRKLRLQLDCCLLGSLRDFQN